MFTEPQTVTINAVAKDLPRVSIGDRSGIFESTSLGYLLRIFHVNGKRKRHTVRLDATKTAADPLLDGVSRQYSMSAYLVIDRPLVGYSDTEAGQVVQGLVDWADTAGNLSKVIGGES